MLRTLVVVTLALAFSIDGLAQTTFATITGIVTDPQGGAIPGAQVTATQVESNYKYTVRSNEVGYYTLGQLLQGQYVLRVEAPGFNAFQMKDIILTANDQRRVDVRMEVGAVSETVQVTGTAAAIETESARISDTKLADQIKNLPLNTRSLWTFLGQTPGVLQAVSDTATRRFSGSRNNQSDASIDGITVSNGRDGTQITPLVSYVESFQEVRVDMGNNTAEFGSLGQVTVVSKSGTNTLHGAGFDYYQTPGFRARDPFTGSRDGNINHRPGFAVGGPVYFPRLYNGKNRTFFFYSFETARGSQARDNLVSGVPLEAWRQGDLSKISTAVRDPFGGGQPFPGNIIPKSRINTVSQKIQDKYYPLPNYGNPDVFSSSNFRMTAVRPFDPSTYWTTRLDHRFNDKTFVFGRFTWVRQYTRPWENNLPTLGIRWNQRENQGANVSVSHTFRMNLLNEIRWGVAYNDQPRHGPQQGLPVVKELGLQGLAPDLPDVAGMLVVNWSGLGIRNLTQERWRHPGYKNKFHQIQEQLSWYRGRHTLKFGAMANRVYYADLREPEQLFGSVTFGNTFTGYTYGDFLLGIPTTSQRAFPAMLDRQLRWSYDFFVTDQFKIAPTLTLDFGLRYEIHPSATNMDGYNATFNIDTGKIVVSDSVLNKVSKLMPQNYVGVMGASAAGLPDSLLRTDRNNFAPRIGLAWRPLGPNTVFRAGYGLYYDVVPESAASTGIPFTISEPSYTNPRTSPTVILPVVFPGTGTGGPSTVSLPTAYDPNVVIPYSMQYNATIEHLQGNNAFRLSYIGTNTRKGVYGINVNQPLPGPGLYVQKPRRFPTYPDIVYQTNGAGHQYNAMTAELRRRSPSGLSYQFSYTLARDIGDAERNDQIENAYDRARERSVWVDIPTHRINANAMWDIPVGKGKKVLSGASGVLNAIAGGWSLSAVFTYHSGHFLTPYWTGPDPTGTGYTASTTPRNVTIRPNAVRDPNLPSDQRTTSRWFDASAFTAPGAYFGNAAKGLIKGPHVNIWDLGIFKEFRIRERVTLRWEMTAVNLLNHPNYSDPACTPGTRGDSSCATNISNVGTVGTITSVDGVSALDPSGTRSLRMGLRLEF